MTTSNGQPFVSVELDAPHLTIIIMALDRLLEHTLENALSSTKIRIQRGIQILAIINMLELAQDRLTGPTPDRDNGNNCTPR